MNLTKIQAELKAKRTELEDILKAIVSALAALKDSKSGRQRLFTGRKRQLSSAGRKRIVEAQKARWASYKQKKKRQQTG
jgi:hypothetical protein